MNKPHRSHMLETPDSTGFITFRWGTLSEMSELYYGIRLCGQTLKNFALYGNPIYNEKKKAAATILMTRAALTLTKKLIEHILTSFPSITINDLLPGAPDVQMEGEKELIASKEQNLKEGGEYGAE